MTIFHGHGKHQRVIASKAKQSRESTWSLRGAKRQSNPVALFQIYKIATAPSGPRNLDRFGL